ncbi:MAG: MurR/RpiR family transcriptional regulator [Acidimicrobiia bacterium]|nr:MAG: MurR/RpiR family transcriptional regulator [Acidimicrobiia bacterium]
MAASSTTDLIAAVGDRLTPAERRIAEAVLAEPTLLAFGTVSDLAGRVGTSRPSVVRFATKLGFDGYTQLQDHVRSGLSQQLSRPSDRIRLDEATLPAQSALEDALASVFEAAEDGRLAALAKPIATAANVWVISGETSRAGAHALHSGLTMVRPGVHLIEDHSMGQDLAHAARGDVAVVFDFLRYRRRAVRATRRLADLGVNVVAITDGPLSPLAALTEHWCELRVPAIGPFDSSVPAVAMAELLVAQVADRLHDEATERLDHTEDLWEATETFLEL